MAAFPEGRLDETRQPLDLSTTNSWSRRLGEVPTVEMLQTLAANAAAPFVLVSRLAPLLSAAEEGGEGGSGLCSHVINVSAVEGKFSVPKKMTIHPHTNMGKAVRCARRTRLPSRSISRYLPASCYSRELDSSLAPLSPQALNMMTYTSASSL